MADTARGKHSSPGIYSREEVMSYSSKSLGITNLGLVGECQRGPAFQVMNIADWNEFQSMFGGTSAEKFKGSQYPKYELPYIAKSYLTQSHQLNVVRVLGLSGYNAGPAWVVTASSGASPTEKTVIAVLRSRGTYNTNVIAAENKSESNTECLCKGKQNDMLYYYVGETKITDASGCTSKSYNTKALKIKTYNSTITAGDSCGNSSVSKEDGTWDISTLDKGHFTIECWTGRHNASETLTRDSDGYHQYGVSLNPADPDYIVKMLGTTPDDGDTPIFVESLYDGALAYGIKQEELTQIDSAVTEYNAYHISDYCQLEPVNDLLTLAETSLSRRHVGKRYLATTGTTSTGANITCHLYDIDTDKYSSATTVTVGTIYTVKQYTTKSGAREYYYVANQVPSKEDDQTIATMDRLSGVGTWSNSGATLVKNNADGLYYKLDEDAVKYVSCNLNDYRSSYRYASTPWIVSNLKGDFDKLEVNKMFRFHTISDGSNANFEVKVSIENILPDEGLFDVVVRDINDIDASPVILEKFTKCSMVPGENNYILYRIGSFDGTYEVKSKYISVEINDTTPARNSVPSGFLGYPTPQYGGSPISGNSHTQIKQPNIIYNTAFDANCKNKKQYFGLSDKNEIGIVDIDMFTYKGRTAYIERPEFVSNGFHLDCRVNADTYSTSTSKPTITVDGVSGYTFQGVSHESTTQVLSYPPIIAKESEMEGTIYEYKNLRKFTVYFYGGFDGWDSYRTERSNTDNFKMTKYNGYINANSGEGQAFDKIAEPELLNLNQNGITSDWYAYLSAIRQFANPALVDVNVFATPGIDMINQNLLVQETIDMIEDERGDSIYIATMPDKPSGAGDFADEMYKAEDVTDALDEYEYDSNYTATYYPWVKYEDTDNSQYIYLPATKDVVRNLAQTDNSYQPWFAPAGVNRGSIDGIRTKRVLKLADEDELYEHGINPIKTFSTDGTVKVWGQKTIQLADNQLNRIATRRLLLRLRKLVTLATVGFIFDPNDTTTGESLRSAITPILDNLKSNRGLSDYKLKIDDSAEMREKYELGVQIFLKPYTQLEYISFTFTLTPQGVNFDEL